jgi:predicted secreted Zn-dependent protease
MLSNIKYRSALHGAVSLGGLGALLFTGACSRENLISPPPHSSLLETWRQEMGVSISFYPVDGTNLAQVQEQMKNKYGPYLPEENKDLRHYAITYPYLSWEARNSFAPETPLKPETVVNHVSVLLSTTVILPWATQLHRMPSAEQQYWTNTFYPSLLAHERRHQVLAYQALTNLSTWTQARLNRGDLTAGELTPYARRIVRELNTAQHDFDRTTGSGTKEGATLEPITGSKDSDN